MVRPQESGQTARAVSSARMAVAPIKSVVGGRRGMGMESAADGEDGTLQFGWDPSRALVAGPRPVVEALGSGLSSGYQESIRWE
jgi:hypothetical protein